jgi:ankyrin repeat protein
MSASLPDRPSLEWLRKLAKDYLPTLRATRPDATLAEAQLAVAREYGFSSWRALKAHVDQRASRPDPLPDQAVAEFLHAVGTGSLDDVHAMLATAPSMVNAVGPHPFWGGRPQALHVAIEGKRRDMFDLLLASGADVNGTNDGYDHWSPVMLAINRDRADMVDDLLRRDARVGLLEALLLADDRKVDDLLGSAPLPDIAPNAGSILAFARTVFAIDRLIELGAPTDLKDRWGSTPIDAMSRMGARGQALVKHLIARGIGAAPQEYVRLGDLESLARLHDSDPAVAQLDAVMMAAVDFGHYAIVDWLLARGGTVSARSDAASHHTALHSAAWNGDLRMVKMPVDAGADTGARDDQYNGTPLGWAATSIEVSNNPKCVDVVAYLTTIGAPE